MKPGEVGLLVMQRPNCVHVWRHFDTPTLVEVERKGTPWSLPHSSVVVREAWHASLLLDHLCSLPHSCTPAASMLTRGRKARVAVRPEAAHSALPPLPLPCVLDILSRLAPGERLLASAVSRAWRAAVAQPSLWTSVDFTQERAYPHTVSDALLAAVVSKAPGQIRCLRVWFCKGAGSESSIVAAVQANAGSLRSLNILSTAPHAIHEEEDGLCLMKDDVDFWLRAAPNLLSFEADVMYRRSFEDAHALLTGQGPYSVVRPARLIVDDFSADDVVLLARDIGLHPSLEELFIHNTPLETSAVLGAIVDATVASCGLTSLCFSVCNLGPQSATYVARMLPYLSSLLIERDYIFDAGSTLAEEEEEDWVSALCASSLTALRLDDVGLWNHEGVGDVVVDALVGHPTLQEISLANNRILFDDSQNTVGACWARLITANSPSLRKLSLALCEAGDDVLRPVIAVLASNTTLRALYLHHNALSAPFARDVVLPSVRANTSLRVL